VNTDAMSVGAARAGLLVLGDIAGLDPMDEPAMPHGRFAVSSQAEIAQVIRDPRHDYQAASSRPQPVERGPKLRIECGKAAREKPIRQRRTAWMKRSVKVSWSSYPTATPA
jgi:hypothetical protein